MLRTAMLVSAIALGSAHIALAADTTSRPPATAAHPAPAGNVDANKLIGQNIKNADNDTIGEVKSVRIGANGQVDAVIVGVGGFLGIGEREVALDWKELTVTDEGRKVSVAMTKDQLKALPEYKYADASHRGHVFSDTRVSDSRAAAPAPARDAAAPARDRGTAAHKDGDFNARGEISGNALIGATVKNAANETVGEVEDVYLDRSGSVKALIVSVGGAMGIGAKDVMLGWQDLKVGRDQNKLVLTTPATKESLKSMPEYKR